MQYLYLIHCKEAFKIGIATDVRSRMASLQTGNPYLLELENCYEFTNAEPVERALHQAFAKSRMVGEWFCLSNAELQKFDTICGMLGGVKIIMTPPVSEDEIEEAEDIADTAEGAKFDYAAMFADGWQMYPSNSTMKKDYWIWRKRKDGERKYLYGGRISDLPYPDLDTMRRIYRDGEPAAPAAESEG